MVKHHLANSNIVSVLSKDLLLQFARFVCFCSSLDSVKGQTSMSGGSESNVSFACGFKETKVLDFCGLNSRMAEKHVGKVLGLPMLGNAVHKQLMTLVFGYTFDRLDSGRVVA
jgi:hypothetical protein